MDVLALSNLVCRDLVRRVGRSGGRSFIVSTFTYPDGDFINLYVESPKNGETYLSDFGTTLFKCAVDRVSLNDTREDRIRTICRLHDIEYCDGAFRRRIRPQAAGLDFLSFCQALTRVSNLQFESEAREMSPLAEEVNQLLQREVAPQRSIVRRWTHPEFDPNKDFPVDYHVGGAIGGRNIFYVGSSGKSNLVVAVSSFLKLHAAGLPTLSIVDPTMKLSSHPLRRLQIASTEIRFGVTGNERDIVAFALADINSGPRSLAIQA